MTLRRRRSISLNATAAQAALICQLFELPARALDPMVETISRYVSAKNDQRQSMIAAALESSGDHQVRASGSMPPSRLHRDRPA